MIIKAICLLAVLMLAACTAPSQAITECSNPRPEMCAMHYDPVCATRDKGVQCVTTACDTTELKTYGNACSACSDETVRHHRAGACDDVK